MKEDDTIFYQDKRGVMVEVSRNEYESDERTRAVVDECLGAVTRSYQRELPVLPGTGWTREQPKTQGKNQRLPIREAGGKESTQAQDKPL